MTHPALLLGLGPSEMALIAGVALLLFGPKRLPELGRSLGEGLRGFREATASAEPSEPPRSA